MNRVLRRAVIVVLVLLSLSGRAFCNDLPDNHAVMKYIATTTRDVLLSMGQEFLPSENYTYEKFFEPEHVAGFCELAESVIFFLCDDLGIPRSALTRFQGTSCLGDLGVRHASVIITLEDGTSWLMDPTFNQFMDQKDIKQNQIGYPGVLLRKTHEGRHFAHKLVEQGYIQFDDKTANLYGKVLSRDPELSDYDVQFFIDNDEGIYRMTRYVLGSHTWPPPPEHLIRK